MLPLLLVKEPFSQFPLNGVGGRLIPYTLSYMTGCWHPLKPDTYDQTLNIILILHHVPSCLVQPLSELVASRAQSFESWRFDGNFPIFLEIRSFCFFWLTSHSSPTSDTRLGPFSLGDHGSIRNSPGFRFGFGVKAFYTWSSSIGTPHVQPPNHVITKLEKHIDDDEIKVHLNALTPTENTTFC